MSCRVPFFDPLGAAAVFLLKRLGQKTGTAGEEAVSFNQVPGPVQPQSVAHIKYPQQVPLHLGQGKPQNMSQLQGFFPGEGSLIAFLVLFFDPGQMLFQLFGIFGDGPGQTVAHDRVGGFFVIPCPGEDPLVQIRVFLRRRARDLQQKRHPVKMRFR